MSQSLLFILRVATDIFVLIAGQSIASVGASGFL
jgi:hypothetical protein